MKFAGRFAKGKIHCSCFYCRKKTWEMGLPKSDLVKLDRAGDFDDCCKMLNYSTR
ncbi:hypothetical protein GCM10010911_55740 [Paenibacillus nasutitermitis]|uniref:Uncharacterized protein n=1 Tax=Paenibacillus nasutitermitis TaxID=1652958 RepID=A0A916ZEE6_9BACL|nr:hypothetical protein GCM10010911_55740 [Paenibacillus nasutitermitis]